MEGTDSPDGPNGPDSPGARTSWLAGLAALTRTRRPGVLVTALPTADAPGPVAKLVVGRERTWGGLGSTELDRVAAGRAATVADRPVTTVVRVPGRGPAAPVTLLFEPLRPPPTVAVFGLGHVGLELAVLLSRHDLDLHLVDSRAAQFDDRRLAVLADPVATVHTWHRPLLPEQVVDELPAGAHVLVMTHDHAEDLAICDAALRRPHVSTVGLIGSAAKAARFRRTLLASGLAAELGRLRCPIGIDTLPGKEPAVLAVGVAAELLALVARAPGDVGRVATGEAVR